jgi:hypothetical protein
MWLTPVKPAECWTRFCNGWRCTILGVSVRGIVIAFDMPLFKMIGKLAG